MSQRVVLTGAPGWLGTTLAKAIAEGGTFGPASVKPRALRCVVEPNSDVSVLSALAGEIEVVRADLRDPNAVFGACEGADVVVHSAGVIHPRRIRDLYQVNVDGTRHMLHEATRCGVKRFVFISSNSPAGLSLSHTHKMREEEAERPYFNYGISKQKAEELVNGVFQAGDLETVILRPCWFYGPNQPERQSRFFRMIQAGNPLVFGDGENLRSMSYVDNTVQGILLAMEAEKAAGRTYWMTDKRPYSFNEILETVAELLEVKKFKPRYVPSLVSTACQLADGLIQKTGFYQKEIHVVGELASSIAVSVERAEDELGYDPQVELQEGMRRSIEWCRSVGQL